VSLFPYIFSDYSFLVHHPVNQDDRHLLPHAMDSDFSVVWQHLSLFCCVLPYLLRISNIGNDIRKFALSSCKKKPTWNVINIKYKTWK
jgi:hypothetical protein